MDVAAANALFQFVLAPWVKDFGLVVEAVSATATYALI